METDILLKKWEDRRPSLTRDDMAILSAMTQIHPAIQELFLSGELHVQDLGELALASLAKWNEVCVNEYKCEPITVLTMFDTIRLTRFTAIPISVSQATLDKNASRNGLQALTTGEHEDKSLTYWQKMLKKNGLYGKYPVASASSDVDALITATASCTLFDKAYLYDFPPSTLFCLFAFGNMEWVKADSTSVLSAFNGAVRGITEGEVQLLGSLYI